MMKTSWEIPDVIFRRAKAMAAEQNVPLRQFVSEAVEQKLAAKRGGREKARRKPAGNLSHLRSETARINQLMDQEFEKIEPRRVALIFDFRWITWPSF